LMDEQVVVAYVGMSEATEEQMRDWVSSEHYDSCSQCGWETTNPNDSHACEVFNE